MSVFLHFSVQNITYFTCSPIHLIVDDLVTIMIGVAKFVFCLPKPFQDCLFAFGCPASKSSFEFLFGAWGYEDRNSLGVQLYYFHGTLDIYFQNNPFPISKALLDLFFEGSVPISAAEDLETLDEISVFSPLLKILGFKEMIIVAIDLAGPWRSGGCRDAGYQRQLAQLVQAAKHGRLAGPGRTGNNDHSSVAIFPHNLFDFRCEL
jgi:hypothetical protein